MKLKFTGDYARLQRYVSKSGLAGKWRDLQHGHKQYRTDEGGVLNWWRKSGALTFQGLNLDARDELAEAFVAIASAKGLLFGEYGGRQFCGRLRSLYPDS
jgi:hypothetical protein